MYKIPDPYSDCKDVEKSDSETIKSMLKTRYKYKQNDCFRVCFQKYLIKECGCQDTTQYMIDESVGFCMNLTQFICSAAYDGRFFSQENNPCFEEWF